jgi:RNA ligase (TIGR02306 family)
MRKMATIKKIQEISSIDGADKICAYRIDGWWVVDTIGKFQVGDTAIYLEIDSWVPNQLAPFLSKGTQPRVYEGVEGERLRTVKLRGQISQGLLLPMKHLTNYGADLDIGTDVSAELGILKYEPPISAQLSGTVKGLFPSFIHKTDQERIQNLSKEFLEWSFIPDLKWEVSEKLDGSSMTVFFNKGEVGVCSRNLELKEDENNSFWKVARGECLIAKLQSLGLDIALQGELIGEGIQKNPYGIKGQKFLLFDIYDINSGNYYAPSLRQAIARDLRIEHVPIVYNVGLLFKASMNDLLKFSEGKSKLNTNTEREGLVFKSYDGKNSFKVISNKFLMKNGD